MGRFVKGDVVVLPFPFSDLSATKKRPALVIATASPHDDVILCMITSRNTTDINAVPFTRSDFAGGSLPRDGNIRPNRLFTADANIILRTAGRLSPNKLQAVIHQIIKIVSA